MKFLLAVLFSNFYFFSQISIGWKKYNQNIISSFLIMNFSFLPSSSENWRSGNMEWSEIVLSNRSLDKTCLVGWREMRIKTFPHSHKKRICSHPKISDALSAANVSIRNFHPWKHCRSILMRLIALCVLPTLGPKLKFSALIHIGNIRHRKNNKRTI